MGASTEVLRNLTCCLSRARRPTLHEQDGPSDSAFRRAVISYSLVLRTGFQDVVRGEIRPGARESHVWTFLPMEPRAPFRGLQNPARGISALSQTSDVDTAQSSRVTDGDPDGDPINNNATARTAMQGLNPLRRVQASRRFQLRLPDL